MRRVLLTGGLLVVLSTIAFAAKKKANFDYQPDVKMTVEELLSLPGANRLEVAKKRGSEFAPSLEKLAFSPAEDYRVRWKSLILAAQIEGAKAGLFLDRAVKAPEWYIRNAGLLAYQDVLPKKAKVIAEKLLNDKALVVRSAAVQVLAQSMDESVRETLWDQIGNAKNFRKKQSLFIRGQILSVLAQDPREKEIPLYMKHLNESDTRLHSPAIAALERVTARKFGNKKDTVDKKRDLWIQWAKNTPESR